MATLSSSLADVGGLDIKLQSARKVVSNETFIVVCTDDKGLALTWRGPKGILGPKTRPVVDTKPYGTSIVFNGSRMEDTGDYTCSNGKEHADFHLTVESKWAGVAWLRVIQWGRGPSFPTSIMSCLFRFPLFKGAPQLMRN